MEKKVSYCNYCIALEELKEDFGWNRGIKFYDMGNRYYGKPEVNLGVNWSAFGTKSPEETIKFAELLQRAAKAAAEFKYNGYIVTYGEEEQ